MDEKSLRKKLFILRNRGNILGLIGATGIIYQFYFTDLNNSYNVFLFIIEMTLIIFGQLDGIVINRKKLLELETAYNKLEHEKNKAKQPWED